MRTVLLLATLTALGAPETPAQQPPLIAPMVAGCPAPVPPQWPTSACQYQFYPLTDTSHAIASVSKTAPVYQHTLAKTGGYAPTSLLVACPAGAFLSANAKTCTNGGVDVSGLVAFSELSHFAIVPGVATRNFPLSWQLSVDGYLVQHSTDGGKTWDVGQTLPSSTGSYTYVGLPTNVPQCFRVAVLSKAYGNSDPTMICVPASGPTPAPAVSSH